MGIGDGASGQRIDCCELSNGSSISDVDVNETGDMGAGVGDEVAGGVSNSRGGIGDGASGQRIDCCELSNGGSISDVDVNGAGDVGARECLYSAVAGGVSNSRSGIGDGASGQRIDCCELSNGSSISDVDVNGAGDVGAGVGDEVAGGAVIPEVEWVTVPVVSASIAAG